MRIDRLSGRPLLISLVRAWVGVDSRGGEIGLGGRDKLLDASVCVSPIILHCEQVIGSVFEHQGARGIILRVQGIQGNQAPFQIQPLKELAGHRDLIGLVFFHDRTAQVKLAGTGDDLVSSGTRTRAASDEYATAKHQSTARLPERYRCLFAVAWSSSLACPPHWRICAGIGELQTEEAFSCGAPADRGVSGRVGGAGGGAGATTAGSRLKAELRAGGLGF